MMQRLNRMSVRSITPYRVDAPAGPLKRFRGELGVFKRLV
jgi:hypothetical protein